MNSYNKRKGQIHSLSYGQQALWSIYKEAPTSAAYNMALPLQFNKDMAPELVEQAVQKLLVNHPSLRTTFGECQGLPYQQFESEIEACWQHIDASDWTNEALTAQVQQGSQAPFVLEEGVFRATLYSRAQGGSVLLFSLHHIAGDAASLAIIGQQFLQCYAALAGTTEAPNENASPGNTSLVHPSFVNTSLIKNYADYVHWESELLVSKKGQRMTAYWEKQLSGEVPVLQLPTDYPRPPEQTFNGASHPMGLSSELTKKLNTLAKAHKSTLFTVLLSAWQVLLHRYSGQSDIWTAVPTSIARNHPEFTDMVGYFVNPMIVRTHFYELSFSELVSQTGRQMLSGLYHQPYPFAKLIDQLQTQRDPSYPPLVQAMFALERSDLIPKRFSEEGPSEEGFAEEGLSEGGSSENGLSAERRDIAQMEAQFDLSLTWFENTDGQPLSAVFTYNRDLFTAQTIARLAGNLQILLEAVVSQPEQSIHQLPLLSTAENKQLVEWDNTKTELPSDLSMLDLFEQQAEKTPNNVALLFADKQLSYQQLDEQANQLAHYLQTHYLQGKDSTDSYGKFIVAIAVERSLDMVIALLAILKAGGAYVPIDPNYPAVRIEYMLAHSGASVLLTQSHLKNKLPTESLGQGCKRICLDDRNFTASSFAAASKRPVIKNQADELAYIIFTSGSTGHPKGVAINHRSVVNTLQDINQRFGIVEQDRVLALSALSFDLSVYDIFGALACGAGVVIPDADLDRDPAHWAALMHQHKVTLWNTVPALMQMLVDYLGETTNLPESLRLCMMSGDWIPLTLPSRIKNLWPETQIISLGGATEASVWSCYYPIEAVDPAWLSVPYGKPLGNQTLKVLTEHMQPCPIGVHGQIYIGGQGLAQGYWRDEDKTQNSFIIHPQTQERLYKTGDKGRYLPDGNIEFLGRVDFQIKIRGFRVELGEIESALSQHPAVNDVLVVLHEANGNQHLVVYLTLDEKTVLAKGELDKSKPEKTAVNKKPESSELKNWLKTRLPYYMLPSEYIILEKLPLTANNKVDRKALPVPEFKTQTSTKPASPTEELLANLWGLVLNRKTLNGDVLEGNTLEGNVLEGNALKNSALKNKAISRDDDFFELGGHSLMATQLVARIRDVFQAELPLRCVFDAPKLSQLAEQIDTLTRGVSLPAIVKSAEGDSKVLSFSQQRLWFLNQLEENSSATYNIPMPLQLKGKLDVEALKKSLSWLVQRHESLRCNFPLVDGQARLRVLEIEPNVLRVYDLRQLGGAGLKIQDLVNVHAAKPFDLADGKLFKADLYQLGEQDAVLLLNTHHIISDAWSSGVFIRDLQHAYSAYLQSESPTLAPLVIQYPDYAAWQRNLLQGEVLQQQVDYWRDQLDGAPELLNLPSDKPRPPQQSFQGATYTRAMPLSLFKGLSALSQQQGSSMFMTLLSAYFILLSRYSRQDDICVGSPIANRTHSQTEDLIGLFVNTQVLRGKLHPQQSFIDLLQTTRQTCLAAYTHQDIPFEMLVEQLQPTRSLSHSPLFQAMLVQNHEPTKLMLPGLETSTLRPEYSIAKFDLTLYVEEREGQLHCMWEYATDLFNASTIERMAEHFEVLLSAIVDKPSQSIGQLSILANTEIQQLQAWNNPASHTKYESSVVELFEQQALKTPNDIALVFENKTLSYQQLNEKSNQLAHHLRASLAGNAVSTDNPLIAIALERSMDMVIGLLGILKAGAAYLPIDPTYPEARIAYMLQDSAAAILLTQSHLKVQFEEPLHSQPQPQPQPQTQEQSREKSDCVLICLDEVDLDQQPLSKPNIEPSAHNIAYVIYTSGSTGTPKGVSMPQAALVNLLLWQAKQPGLDKPETTLQFTTLSFDVSFQEIFSTFLSGGKLVLLDEHTRRDGIALFDYIATQGIERLFVPYVMLQHLAEQQSRQSGSSRLQLKNIITAGEQLRITPQINALMNDLPNCRLHNHYGPSESHVVTAYTLPHLSGKTTSLLPPIGSPIANTSIYILSSELQAQPIGIPGELCIAGSALARGYFNRPDLTAEKFIEVELFPGTAWQKTERIYKTGDLARWIPAEDEDLGSSDSSDSFGSSGNLEYLGRLDSQVKLRGFRIELGEIEAVLNQHECVKDAVVKLCDVGSNKRLVAYITQNTGENLSDNLTPKDLSAVKNWLKERLLDYMIPSQFMVLDQLPLTPSGKIDRRALPVPEMDAASNGTRPTTTTEELLAGLWSTLLDCEFINRQDNFFELGGHSLLATQLVARIRDTFQAELPVRTVFESPQLSALASVIEAAIGSVTLPAIEVKDQGAAKELSFAQQRLWFLNHLEGNNTATYNMPMPLQLSGRLNVSALRQSLHWLIERHESLNSCFPNKNGQAIVKTRDVMTALSVHVLKHLSSAEQEQDIQERINRHAIEPFDLANGPLFKADLLLIDEQEFVLLLNMHHIVCDGWSLRVLTDDLQAAYAAFCDGGEPNMPPLDIQYSDYASWQREWLQGEVLQQQLNYWQQQLVDIPEILKLPTDKPRPAQQSFRGAHYPSRLSPELSTGITRLSRELDASVFMTLLSAFYIFLSRYSCQDDICVGSPIASRTRSETENLIGLFVNTLVLRARLQPEQNFVELLQATRLNCLSAYAHQDIPFEMLVEQVQPTRSLSHSPLFQVMLVLHQEGELSELSLPGLTTKTLNPDYPVAKFDLTLHVEKRGEQLRCVWEYATDLFNAETIAKMADHFEMLLAGIIDKPLQSISHLPMLMEAEIQHLYNWNNTATEYPQDKTVVDLFELQAVKTPNNIAVTFGTQALTYKQLNEQSNQLAHHLVELKQVVLEHGTNVSVDNCLIAIVCERSLEMLVGILGVLKSGNAYLPIDPSYPTARILDILEDSAVSIVLTQRQLVIENKLPIAELTRDCHLVCLDEAPSSLQIGAPKLPRNNTDLAYVIYTSGSTGKPKGVTVAHGGLSNLALALIDALKVDEHSRFLQFASLSFDASVIEIVTTLLTGATLYLVPKTKLLETVELSNLLVEQKITHIVLPPTFINNLPEYALAGLKTLVVAGEACPQKLVKQWANKVRFINAYGPTECTVAASIATDFCDTDRPHIGRPLANTRIYIVNSEHQVQPPGVPGELCIAGAGVTPGYLNRPELTAEKFIKVEFFSGTRFSKTERIYKTGDLARWTPEGNLEYLGRVDHQVKLRGFRIELGEIESVLIEQGAKEAVVIVDESRGDKRLVAYFSPANTCELSSDAFMLAIKSALRARLPDYMVPSHFVILDKLPLTPSGKIDRKALPLPKPLSQNDETSIKPQTTVERQIAKIWQDVLSLEHVGTHDNFFDLGGHSLLLMQVQSQLQTVLDKTLPVVKLLQYPTINSLATYLNELGLNELGQSEKNGLKPKSVLSDEKAKTKIETESETDDIAIIGMAGSFPGAKDIDQFWHNLRNGIESIQFFSDEELLASGNDPERIKHPDFVNAGAVLESVEFFDSQFFGYTPREADCLDPQLRIFLECAWASLEYAGYDVDNIDFPVGVFAGADASLYLTKNVHPNRGHTEILSDFQLFLGDREFIAASTAYKLNLKGPTLFVYTACSTSLVAVHTACENLLNHKCDVALAGAGSVLLPQKQGYLYQQGMIFSPDGHCRAFDAQAQGAVAGAGVGVVTLKRLSQALSDGDSVHAVIKGSAINNDGMDKVGFTAPSVTGQAAVIEEAMKGLDFESITYVEAHGTATALGDPIEVSALTQAYQSQTQKTGYCAIGSVKTNVGHLSSAAGVTSLIKTVLALKNREIPPSLHFETPNPEIDFANSPFFVNAQLRAWESAAPLRAGVSSFGMGGTNAHVVLEEAPVQTSSESTRKQLISVSAKTEAAFERACDQLAEYLDDNPELNLADVAYTLNLGRKSFNYRGFLIGDNSAGVAEVASQLRERKPKYWRHARTQDKSAKIVFMFSGQGTQYANMGRGLYDSEPVFRNAIDEGAEILKPLMELDIRDLLYPEAGLEPDLKPSVIAQPALFVTEYALAKLCISWGLEPTAMIGYSIGEYVAACIAGVFSLADALQLVTVRSQLMDDLSSGEMLSILLPKSEVEALVRDQKDLYLAAHNAPDLCVVAGTVIAMTEFKSTLKSQHIMHVALQTNNAAHSPLMAPIMVALREQLGKITLNPPERPYLANLSGTWITATQATSVDYWCDQLLNTVLFSEGLDTLLADDDYILLELGPEMSLTSFALQHQNLSQNQSQNLSQSKSQGVSAFNLLRTAITEQSDEEWLLNTLGQIWLKGAKLDWAAFYANEQRLRIPLPTYSFERQRHWMEAPLTPPLSTQLTEPAATDRQTLDKWFYSPQWKRVSPPALDRDAAPLNLSSYLIFSDEAGLGADLGAALQKQGIDVTRVQAGEVFESLDKSANNYSINPSKPEDYQQLFNALRESGNLPQAVLHLWGLNNTDDFEQAQLVGFYSLLFIAQAWPSLSQVDQLVEGQELESQQENQRHLFVLSNQVQAVTDSENLNPTAATLLGPVQTIAKEYPDLQCRNLDIVPQASKSKQQVLLMQILAECQFSSQERIVAYRNKYRWVRSFEPTQFSNTNSKPAILRQQGVYLITSIENMGLSLGTYLAESLQAKIVFLAQTNSSQIGGSESVAIPDMQLRRLQEAGGEVLVITADVSKPEQMQAALEQAQARFGALHGVIHNAGIFKKRLIADINTTELSRGLVAKVQGSLLLTQLIDVNALDFIVFCSSSNALMEKTAQAEDCAANAFLDAYAAALSSQDVNALSINWDHRHAEDAYAIQADEAPVAFERILNALQLGGSVTQVLLSTVDWQQRLQQQESEAELLDDAETVADTAVVRYNRPALANDAKLQRHNRPDLSTEYVEPESEIEKQLVEIWQSLFGIEPIGIYDNFFELGGHSLLGLQFLSRLRDDLSLEIPLEDVFARPILKEVAACVSEQEENKIPPIIVRSEDEPLILSFSQQRMWFMAQIEGPSPTYNLTDAFYLSGDLNIGILEQSLHWVISRHNGLRTYFSMHDGEAQLQVIDIDEMELLKIHDLSHLDSETQGQEVKRRANQHAVEPFDLAQGPLFKIDLLLLSDQQFAMLLNTHHILSDGWSIGVFSRDWEHAYSALVQGRQPEFPPLKAQYSDFSAWQRNWLQGEVLQRQVDFWQAQLGGAPELLELPTDKPRPARQSYKGAHHRHTFSAELTQELTRFHQQQGVSLFMLLLSVSYILLSRYSRQDDICVGSAVANRNHHAEAEDIIGLFVNTLVFRGKVQPEKGFVDLLKETRDTCLGAYAHQDIPFDVLVEQLQVKRSLSYNPLFQFVLALPSNLISELSLPGVTNTPLLADYPVAKFDMTLYALERNGQLMCFWEYATDLFELETVAQMARHFEKLLSTIVANPDQTIGELSLLMDEDFDKLDAWSRAKTYVENKSTDALIDPVLNSIINPIAEPIEHKDTSIVELFEQQAQKTPDNIAVTFEGRQLSYQQLNERANQLAHHLLSSKLLKHKLLRQKLLELKESREIEANVLVAIACDRSLDMLVGMLGILKAGCAYVPIDPSYPAARIEYILEDTSTSLLLTQSHFKAIHSMAEQRNCATVCLDLLDTQGQSCVTDLAVENPRVEAQASDLAYVIYTSGSTGTPKGVMVEHQSLVNLCHWHVNAFSVQANDKATLVANNAFDASVWELWPYLISGACVQPTSLEAMVETGLWQWFDDNHISIAFLPTPVVEQYAAEAPEQCRHLRLLLTGGDTLHHSPSTLPCPLVNNYGPTENTVVTTSCLVAPKGSQALLKPSIGKPIDNVRVYILDSQNQMQAPGIPGELCIAGAGLARGYLNRPDLTAEKFIELELLGKTERIYKTGDLARWLTDAQGSAGYLEYLGRIDTQVKLRGFRIELGEIESTLIQHDRVKEAVVNLYESDGSKRLVAYLTAQEGAANISDTNTLVTELNNWLNDRLPAHMIPSHFMLLEQFPLTSNDKIDRRALPSPEANLNDIYQAPRNEVEQELADIWIRVLKQEKISIHDNFFELGGDSILSIQVIGRARQLGLQLAAHDVFAHQTLAKLAAAVRVGIPSKAEQGLVTGDMPLTPIQQWFFKQDLPEFWHFNQSELWAVPADINVDALRQAFTSVLSHHDALRLRYTEVDGAWQQNFSEPMDFVPFIQEDLNSADDPIEALYEATLRHQVSFNLSEGPLTCLVLFNWGDERRVFWSAHHLVVDAVSWSVLQEDLETSYQQIVTGQDLNLPAKTSSFKAWSQGLTEYSQSDTLIDELNYWQALASAPLPIDKPRGLNAWANYQDYRIKLDSLATEALLKKVPAVYKTQINDVLLTAFALTLTEWTGKDHCLLNLEGHGRKALFDEIDLSRSVGWFTTLHPVALRLDKSSTLGASLQSVKSQLKNTPHDGIGYGLLTQLRGEDLPKGDVAFNYLGQRGQGMESDLFSPASEDCAGNLSYEGLRVHLIDVNAWVSEGQLQVTWSYSDDCYEAGTIEALAKAYQKHLSALIKHCEQRLIKTPNYETSMPVTLKPLCLHNGSSAAIFCLPGVGGKAGYFLPLAKTLETKLSVYGLESPGYDDHSQIPETVEALAQHHLSTIKRVQPNGPYYLMGHSYGAAVALELAWLLEQAGETIALFGVVDQVTPVYMREHLVRQQPSEFDCLWEIVENFIHLAGVQPSFSFADLKNTKSLNFACRTVMNWLKAAQAHDLLFSAQGLPEELLGLVKVHRANLLSIADYSSEDKPLACAVELFCAADSIEAWEGASAISEDWGWGVQCGKGVSKHVIDGSHFSMLKPPYVQVLADRLAGALERDDDLGEVKDKGAESEVCLDVEGSC